MPRTPHQHALHPGRGRVRSRPGAGEVSPPRARRRLRWAGQAARRAPYRSNCCSRPADRSVAGMGAQRGRRIQRTPPQTYRGAGAPLPGRCVPYRRPCTRDSVPDRSASPSRGKRVARLPRTKNPGCTRGRPAACRRNRSLGSPLHRLVRAGCGPMAPSIGRHARPRCAATRRLSPRSPAASYERIDAPASTK